MDQRDYMNNLINISANVECYKSDVKFAEQLL